ncbi:heat shock cognate 70 kDa protein-like protein [Tanacetum coccineum]
MHVHFLSRNVKSCLMDSLDVPETSICPNSQKANIDTPELGSTQTQGKMQASEVIMADKATIEHMMFLSTKAKSKKDTDEKQNLLTAAIQLTAETVDNKMLIRNIFSDSTVQPDMKLWPFKVIVVEQKGKYEEYSPEEISCMILNNLKESAKAFLAAEVVDVVITILAYFIDKQRHTIKDASTLAALNVMRLISKLTTANWVCSRKEC